RQLTKIWEELLGVQALGVRDNFFDLGGHSLLAARLLVEVERVFGRELPLTTLTYAPTVEELARLLREEGCRTPSALVPVQPGGTRPPFFIIHPLAAAIRWFREVSLHLGVDQPFYGLQPEGMATGEAG